MKVLLTGSGGFVGSHFRSLASCESVPFSLRHDEMERLGFEGIDAVVHLAALVHQMHGAQESEYRRINTEMTLELARRAKEAGVRYFLFMSTVKVYGEEREACYEESEPCHPVDAYGESKLEAERGLLALADETFSVGIIRAPMVYGPGVGGNMSRLLWLVERFKVLPFGKINNRRSMIYVENLVRYMESMLVLRLKGIYNAADPEPLSTISLVEMIARDLGVTRHVIRCAPLKWGLKLWKPELYRRLFCSLCISTEKAEKSMPELVLISSEQGIEAMIAWYRHVD